MTEDDRRNNDKEIVPGMEVEANGGELGEQDVSSARIKKVKKDQQGNVEEIEVEKGALFRKQLDVPPGDYEESALEPAAQFRPGAHYPDLARRLRPVLLSVSHRTRELREESGSRSCTPGGGLGRASLGAYIPQSSFLLKDLISFIYLPMIIE